MQIGKRWNLKWLNIKISYQLLIANDFFILSK
jgi:hypothetical protein